MVDGERNEPPEGGAGTGSMDAGLGGWLRRLRVAPEDPKDGRGPGLVFFSLTAVTVAAAGFVVGTENAAVMPWLAGAGAGLAFLYSGGRIAAGWGVVVLVALGGPLVIGDRFVATHPSVLPVTAVVVGALIGGTGTAVLSGLVSFGVLVARAGPSSPLLGLETIGVYAITGGLIVVLRESLAGARETARRQAAHLAETRNELQVSLDNERRLAQELRRRERLEALGRLSASVAHDFNNLLTAIRGSAEEALAARANPEVVRVELETVTAAAERGAELNRALLSFAKVSGGAPGPASTPAAAPARGSPKPPDPPTPVVDVREVLATLRPLLRRAAPGARFRAELPTPSSGDPKGTYGVRMLPGQLEQVILNLVMNAQDAAGPGGAVSLVLSRASGEVRIEVTDDGPGMTPEVLDQAFEPFFTTKGERGTGLGLATSLGLIRGAGGDLRLDSAPGEGTRATILLPEAPLDTVPPDEAEARVEGAPSTTV